MKRPEGKWLRGNLKAPFLIISSKKKENIEDPIRLMLKLAKMSKSFSKKLLFSGYFLF